VKWVYNDGGRYEAGYRYHVNDCVARARAIVTQQPDREVQAALKAFDPVNPRGRGGPKFLTARGSNYFRARRLSST